MKNDTPIAVTSRSFSRHPILRGELLERYSNVRFNDEGLSLKGDALVEFARGCKKLITALEPIDEDVLSRLPELEVIGKYGVGHDMIDKAAMARHGVRLGWTGGVNRRSVAELALTMMISLLHEVPRANLDIRNGHWQNRLGRQLTGKTVGIVGCGHIGKDLTPLLKAFDCKVLAHDRRDFPEFYAKYDVQAVDLEFLLRQADVVTLHLPLTELTRNIISRERLAGMKPEAILINTARGGLVDEQALKEALREGRLAGAGFDVFAPEPPEDPELLGLPNFLATSHIGGSSEEAILAMGRAAIAGLDENEIPSDAYPPSYLFEGK